jgi:hypothetical protein
MASSVWNSRIGGLESATLVGFRKLLDAEDAITVVGGAADGAQAVARPSSWHPPTYRTTVVAPDRPAAR